MDRTKILFDLPDREHRASYSLYCESVGNRAPQPPFPGAIGAPAHKDSRKIYGAASDSFSTRAPTENNGSASSGHY